MSGKRVRMLHSHLLVSTLSPNCSFSKLWWDYLFPPKCLSEYFKSLFALRGGGGGGVYLVALAPESSTLEEGSYMEASMGSSRTL